MYANRDGDSNVAAYQSGEDFIRVRFNDGSVYAYTYASAGPEAIERMKALAKTGEGLNSYIMTNVRLEYEGGSQSKKAASPVVDGPSEAVAYLQDAVRIAGSQHEAAAGAIKLLLKYNELKSKEPLYALLNEVDSATYAFTNLRPPAALQSAHQYNADAMTQYGHALRSYNLYLGSGRVMPSDLEEARAALAAAGSSREQANAEIRHVAQEMQADLPLLPSMGRELK